MPPCVVLASLSCSLQAFGTVRLNAIIFCSAAILRSIALRVAASAAAVFKRRDELVAVLGEQARRVLVLSNWL